MSVCVLGIVIPLYIYIYIDKGIVGWQCQTPTHSSHRRNLWLLYSCGHRWGQSFKLQLGSNILSTHIFLVPCQSILLFLWQCFFKFWPSNSKVKVIAQCHIVGMTSYRLDHIPCLSCWSALPFLRYSYLKNWPRKSKIKVMGEVKVQSHNVSLTSYRLTSLWFHVNWSSHFWDTAFSKVDLVNPRT